jgi:hypothetical protein
MTTSPHSLIAETQGSQLQHRGRRWIGRTLTLLLRLLPLEKTGLVERAAVGDGKRRVTLRPQGRRLLHEARDTAANACAP